MSASKWLTDRATILRWPDDSDGDDDSNIWEGSSDSGSEPETVAEGVPCLFDPEGTSYIREETGEHVTQPATATFLTDEDIREGDLIDVSGVPATYEVRGIDGSRDHLRGKAQTIEVELEGTG